MNQTSKRLVATMLALLLTVLAVGCTDATSEPQAETRTDPKATTEQLTASTGPETVPTEPGSVALPTKYIVLSYPEEIADRVTVVNEDVAGNQTVIFTTDLTGESLELFRFSIGKTADTGYVLGTLVDPTEGELTVCVDVKDYSNGNLDPDIYNEMIDLQNRVNDIIVRFHEDERFVPNV